MTMFQEVQVQYAQERLGEMFEHVYGGKQPAIIRRQEHEDVAMIRREMLETLVAHICFPVTVECGEDGYYCAWSEDLMQWGQGRSVEEAVDDLTDALMEYAELYRDQIDMYQDASNTRPQLPHVFRIWLCETKEDVRRLLEVVQEDAT